MRCDIGTRARRPQTGRRRVVLLRRRQGQVAVAFVVLMSVMLLLTPALMNLGEVARLKTSTAKAADAGALAGASWLGSGTNYLALIARAMQMNYWAVVAIFAVPFCPTMGPYAAMLFTGLYLRNHVFLKLIIADTVAAQAWDNAHVNAPLYAIMNASIDDETGKVENEIRALTDLIDSGQVPTTNPLPFNWVREGTVPQDSSLTIGWSIPPERPDLRMKSQTMFAWTWFPCLFLCFGLPCGCFPAFGWNGYLDLLWQTGWASASTIGTSPWGWMLQDGAGPTTTRWAQLIASFILAAPTFGPCWDLPLGLTQFPIPLLDLLALSSVLPIRPDVIANSSGTVELTVDRTRESGAKLTFWTMYYPPINSTSAATYGGAHVRSNPFTAGDRALVNIQDVL